MEIIPNTKQNSNWFLATCYYKESIVTLVLMHKKWLKAKYIKDAKNIRY